MFDLFAPLPNSGEHRHNFDIKNIAPLRGNGKNRRVVIRFKDRHDLMIVVLQPIFGNELDAFRVLPFRPASDPLSRSSICRFKECYE